MAALNFPANPTDGQVYSANSQTWVYVAAKTSWVTVNDFVLDQDLGAIAALPDTAGYLKKNGLASWSLDTNVVTTIGSYADPLWITSLAASKLTGTALPSSIVTSSLTAVGTLTNLTVTNTITGSVSGNAGTVTNGLYSTGSYADPSWLTSLAASKLTGTTLPSSIVTSSLTSVGTIGTGVWNGTAISDTYLATITTAGKVSNSATTAASANTASAIVARDASGNFSAGTITASLTGNASTATALQTARTINGTSFDGTANITVAAAAGTLTGTTLASNVVSSSLTSVGTLANLTVTNPISGSVTGSSGSTTGNAATATKLATARAINGVSFDGTADITVTAAAGTLTGSTLASGVTASSLTSVGTLNGLLVEGDTRLRTGGVLRLNNPANNASSGVFTNASNALVVQTGGSDRLSLDANGNLAVDTNTLYVDAVNNRVGVGTATPVSAFHSLGTATLGNAGFTNGRINAADSLLLYIDSDNDDANDNNYFAWGKDSATGTGTELMRLGASGNLGLGVTPSAWASGKAIEVGTVGNALWSNGANDLRMVTNAYFDGSYRYATSTAAGMYIAGSSHLWYTAPSGTAGAAISFTQAMVLDASGNLGVGTASPATRLHVNGSGASITVDSDGTNSQKSLYFRYSNAGYGGSIQSDSFLTFYTGGTPAERARITSGGTLLIGTTDDPVGAGNTVTGIALRGSGIGFFSASSDYALSVARNTTDGELVRFWQDGAQEGSISVSGNTVSYNAFAGSHWSQLEDGTKPDILRGTVMEALNNLCEWPGEQNERLPKAKISDTVGSKKVYGVFMDWDNDWTETNDMYITAVGAFICRVGANVVVTQGDLLESNGDGTARVQADDVIRSSTIGKVTSTVKTHQYADGTYCVPTVLYCG